jgi:DNA modification methylase
MQKKPTSTNSDMSFAAGKSTRDIPHTTTAARANVALGDSSLNRGAAGERALRSRAYSSAVETNQAKPRLLYNTTLGKAYVGDSLAGIRKHVANESVQLIMTSPPFALRRKKEYGNKSEDAYIEWFLEFADVFWDKLKPDGSLVIDLGGSWMPGLPTRSLYQFELLVALCRQRGDKNFHLAQDFYWYNPAKLPSPAQWVTIERIRVKDAVNVIWWLSKSPRPKASNTRILKPYSRAMERLLKRQSYNAGRRPSQHHISEDAWLERHDGAIPANQLSEEWDPLSVPENREAALAEAGEDSVNWLEIANTESMSTYQQALRELERLTPKEERAALRARISGHPARFPRELPAFFIDFLTDSKDDLVVDPFAGSNVTGAVAEAAGRRWKAFELHEPYLEGSLARFDAYWSGKLRWHGANEPLLNVVPPTAVERKPRKKQTAARSRKR